ncbi:putative pyrroloquinoline-quinone binding quinoprotein [Chryseobacterium sp. 52]|uniref:outer membrane protein assembly factor BamB family protein n=1 Tax=Chryseobacterium sp. 52 TaxID=2035213 RepID=UPI000C17DC2A|nr:PQQ-binding-like beta-propeller repeat protein [Chryseobacterium sp. 52]PIF44880.1 putative pyrroloquinoline-quinone binding quinoprotein [Chryseobacterium sp. 52]
MIRTISFLLLLFLVSCNKPAVTKDQRHALIANINVKNNLLVYSYWKDKDYAIKIEDLKTNTTIFSTKITDKCFTEPRINHDQLYFPESNNIFTCIDYKNNKVLWKLSTKGRIREFQFVKDDLIIASIDLYGLVAINSDTGKVMYELLLHPDKSCLVDNAPRPIAFDNNYFYVTNFNCTSISAFAISSGKNVWNTKENLTPLSNFVVAGKYIFTGSNKNNDKGEIMLLETQTGKIVFKQNSKFDIFTDPVFYQNKVYYHTLDSQLQEFDIEKKSSKVMYKFKGNEDLGCNQMYLLDHFIYAQDCDYDVNKIDLNTFTKEIADKGQKGLLGVYQIHNNVKFIY